MVHTHQEIRAQPDAWARTLHLASAAREALSPLLGRRVALVGAGSSYYIGVAAAAYLTQKGFGPADATPASVFRPDGYEAALFISRSGTTTEVLEAAAAARQAGLMTACITCEPGSPLQQQVQQAVLVDFVSERSVVQTASATSALLLLRAVADLAAGDALPLNLPLQLEDALSDPLPAPASFEHLVVLGSEWRYGVACEAALKAQEMARLWSERYVPLEYRHGPVSCADGRTLVLVLDPLDARIEALARDVSATGARVVIGRYDPLIELVRVQQLALRAALDRGLDPDQPAHLSRSVVLDSAASPHPRAGT